MWWAIWCAVVVAGSAGTDAAPSSNMIPSAIDWTQLEALAPEDVSLYSFFIFIYYIIFKVTKLILVTRFPILVVRLFVLKIFLFPRSGYKTRDVVGVMDA